MKPRANQINNLIQFSNPKPKIMAPQVKIPKTGTNGTNGVLKPLGKSGSFFLNIITAAQTNIKANNVPILVM
ncbi:hypothetical protein D3C80_1266410 [compost metagenome]